MAKNYDIMGGGISPSFMRNSNRMKRQEKTGAQTAKEGAERLGKFGEAIRKGDPKDIVGRIQDFSKAQAERDKKKKEEEERKKKEKQGGVAPSKGFIERMRDYWMPKKEK